MSEFLDRIQADSRDALKSRDDILLQALRMVLSQAKNARIEKGADLTETEVMGLLQKAIKTRRESIGLFRRGGREDLASREEREVSLLETYLPRPLGEEEVGALVEAI